MSSTRTSMAAPLLLLLVLGSSMLAGPVSGLAQSPAPQPAPARATPQRGTVKSIQGSVMTLTTDAGAEVVVTISASARVQRLAPGSTDLKTADTASLADIAVGDRVLVSGTAGDTPAAFKRSPRHPHEVDRHRAEA